MPRGVNIADIGAGKLGLRGLERHNTLEGIKAGSKNIMSGAKGRVSQIREKMANVKITDKQKGIAVLAAVLGISALALNSLSSNAKKAVMHPKKIKTFDGHRYALYGQKSMGKVSALQMIGYSVRSDGNEIYIAPKI